MKIIFFGTPKFVIPVLQVLTEDFDVVGVVTTPDEPVGRKKEITPTPVKAFATQFSNIKNIFTPQQFNTAIIQQLKDLNPDLFVTAAYGKILPQEVLDIPRLGSLNVHPSLLPKYRGPSPLQATILKGDTQSGVTILKMDEEVDHGPLLTTINYNLTPTETFESLAVTLFAEAAKKISEVINQWASGSLKEQPQDHSKATFTEHITKEMGYIDSANPPTPEVVDRMIRAYYPWPGVWTLLHISSSGQAKKVKLLPNKMVQVEGKNPVDLATFYRGYPEAKEQLEKLLTTNT